MDALLVRYLVIAAFGTILAAFVCVLLTNRTTRPLVMLTEAAERISTTGDLSLDLRLAGNRNDEAGRLGHAFRTMVQELRESREQQDWRSCTTRLPPITVRLVSAMHRAAVPCSL